MLFPNELIGKVSTFVFVAMVAFVNNRASYASAVTREHPLARRFAVAFGKVPFEAKLLRCIS